MIEDLAGMLVNAFGIVRTQDKGVIPFKPYPWQKEYLKIAKKYDKVIIDKSREIGSSTVVVLQYTAETLLYGGDFLITSYKKDSAKFLFEIATLFLYNLVDQLNAIGYHISYKINTQTELVLSDGSHIKATEMSPKVGRSYRYKRLLATEVAFWDNPYKSWQALHGASVKGSRETIESNPNPDDPRGALFEELIEDNNYYKLSYDWRANPTHDEKWHEDTLKTMGKRRFAQEYEHDHTKSASGSLVIPLNAYYRATGDFDPVFNDKIDFGVDVARYGNDSSQVCIFSNSFVKYISFDKLNNVQLSTEVENLINLYHPQRVKVDAVGVGAGVIDILKSKNLPCDIVEVNESMSAREPELYVNARAEMYYNLRRLVMAGKVHIPEDEDIKEAVFHTHYFYKGRRIQIESKDSIKKAIKKSPDKLDALALATYDISTMEAFTV